MVIWLNWMAVLSLAAPVLGSDRWAEAVSLLNAGKAAEARALGEREGKAHPGDKRWAVVLARAYWAQGLKAEAAAAAQRAETPVGLPPGAQHELALYYAQAGNRKRAAVLESQFAKSTEADPAAAARAALLNFEVGRIAEGIPLAETALAREERDDLRVLLARAYEAQGHPEDAARQYRRLLERRPYDEDSYTQFGMASLRMARFQEGVAVLEEGRTKFDKSPQLELALGVGYYAQRRFADAISRFLRVIELSPEVEQPYLYLSQMLDQAGERLPEIVRSFAAWNQSEKKKASAPLVYAKGLLAAGGTLDETEALVNESLRRDARSAEAHLTLGRVYEGQRRWKEAAAALERSLQLQPRQTAAQYRLARVYDRLGLDAKAAAARAVHARLLEQEKQKGAGAEGMR